ncbi:MAG: LysR family transcriptional regulator [Clostridia bacterium]|nr:LysR family transcriptional regulator [Clostridia bacterium]
MNFRSLNYVIALARHKTIVKAAKSLYISQPTYTKFLQNLEREIGIPLFQRIGKEYHLTFAGERYVETANKILDLKNQLDRELMEIAREDQGLLRVAFPLVRGSYVLPYALPNFHKKYPNVQVEVVELDSNEIQEMLLQGDIDLAFFSNAGNNKTLRYESIAEEEYVLILPPDHPLCQNSARKGKHCYPSIDLSDLKEERFIMLDSSQRSKSIMESIFQNAMITPNIGLTLRNISTVIQMVNAGYGYSFVLESHILNLPKSKRPRCFSIGENGVFMTCVAACRREGFHPKYEQYFVEQVREQYQRMLHG